jgi:hypothetical protein
MIYPWVQVIVGGSWFPLFNTFVATQNVWDEILVYVEKVVHGC